MTGPNYRFDIQKPTEGNVGDFRYTATSATVNFYPTARFADATTARAALEPVLKAWEIDFALVQGRKVFSFEFHSCEVEQASPGPGQLSGVGLIVAGGFVTAHISFQTFPQPPAAFHADDLTIDLAQIFLGTRAHPDSILKDAYSFYTRLIYEYESELNAADDLRVSGGVLNEIRKFATQRSDGAHTRKWEKPGKEMPPPLLVAERDWLDRAMGTLVRRCGEIAGGKHDLPKLSVDTI